MPRFTVACCPSRHHEMRIVNRIMLAKAAYIEIALSLLDNHVITVLLLFPPAKQGLQDFMARVLDRMVDSYQQWLCSNDFGNQFGQIMNFLVHKRASASCTDTPALVTTSLKSTVSPSLVTLLSRQESPVRRCVHLDETANKTIRNPERRNRDDEHLITSKRGNI
jgi:hypothetical protein